MLDIFIVYNLKSFSVSYTASVETYIMYLDITVKRFYLILNSIAFIIHSLSLRDIVMYSCEAVVASIFSSNNLAIWTVCALSNESHCVFMYIVCIYTFCISIKTQFGLSIKIICI